MSYNTFAAFYDRLTDNIDYDAGSAYLSGFFDSGAKLLDLACGTGNLTARLAALGYEMTGADLSEDMLAVASSKCNARFIKADMRDFDCGEAFDGCLCCLDSINHLEKKEDWSACFASVARSLKDGGTFVFDVNTVFKHRYLLADSTFIFDQKDFYLAWDNEDAGENKIRILLDFFVFNGTNYDRYSEEFAEVAFPLDDIKELLAPYFEITGVYDNLTLNPPHKESERVFFVCKKK